MYFRTSSQAQALGILQGAVWAAGGDPEPAVWEEVARQLGAKRDPVGFARAVLERMNAVAAAEELGRLLQSITQQENDRR